MEEKLYICSWCKKNITTTEGKMALHAHDHLIENDPDKEQKRIAMAKRMCEEGFKF